MHASDKRLVRRISGLLHEEELDIYLLMLYCLSSDDLDFFTGENRRRVKAIFKILMEDTKRHVELLKKILGMTDPSWKGPSTKNSGK